MKMWFGLLMVGLMLACGSKNDDAFGGSGSPAALDPNASTGSSGSSSSDTGSTNSDTGSNDTGVADGGDGGGTSGGDASGGGESGGDTSDGEESGDDGGGGLSAISVTGFTVTECDESAASTSADIRYDEIGAYVRIKHDAHLANCCADFSLTATASESGDVTIVYDEGDDECDCVCPVNLRYNIVGLPTGVWNVQIPDGLGSSVTIP